MKEISHPANPEASDQILAFAFEQGYEEFKNAHKTQVGQKVMVFGTYLSENRGKVTVTKIKSPLYQISYLTNFQTIDDEKIFSIFDRNKKYTFNLSELYQQKERSKQSALWQKLASNFLIPAAQAIGFTQDSTEILLNAPFRLGQLYDLDPECLINKVQDAVKDVLESDECRVDCFQNRDCDECEEKLQETIGTTVDEALGSGLEECRYQYDLVVDHISINEPVVSGRILQAEAYIDSIGNNSPKVFNAMVEIYDADNQEVYHTGGGGFRDYFYGDTVDLPALEEGFYHLVYQITDVFDDCMIIRPELDIYDPYASCIALENTINNTFDYYFEVLPKPNTLPQITTFTAQPDPSVMDTRDCILPGCPLAARVTFNGVCHDSDGDNTLSFYILEYGDGQAETKGITNFTTTHSYFHPGMYPARVKCRDEYWNGWSNWNNLFITVNEQTPSPNQPPIVYIDAPQPNPAVGKSWVEGIQSYWIFFHTHGLDPDGFILEDQIEWDFGDNTGVTENYTAHHAYQNPGNYTVRVRGKDNRGAWSNWDSTVVQISEGANQSLLSTEFEEPQNSPPQISFPTNVITKKVNEFFDLSATVVDPDPGGGIISYEWDLDGNNVYEWVSSVALRPNCFLSQSGIHYAHLRVVDFNGLTTIGTLKIVIETALSSESETEYMLNAIFIPEIVAEGENQKLTLNIKNEKKDNIIVQGATIDWYWNQGNGFYLSEHQNIPINDSHWITKEVPALTTKTVYIETSRASGRGEWRGEITVSTNARNLTATILHTVR